MPIEVRELIIRTVVDAADEKTTSTSSAKQMASKRSTVDGMESLLEYIKNKNER